jgi:hypothetical protein
MYRIICVNPDELCYSELFQDEANSYTEAVRLLIKLAHYDVDVNGRLRQYKIPTDEYSSYEELKRVVEISGMLDDYDIYKIIKIPI